MEDLNYRIDLPDSEVREMVAGDPDLNVRDLLAFDQVRVPYCLRRKAVQY